MPRVSAVACVLTALALLTGCGSTRSPSEQGEVEAAPRFEEYVALGDSFSAGPFIPNTEVQTGCFRSDHNYASLLAQALEVKVFRDVTCGGAQTKHLRQRHPTLAGPTVPAQDKALTPGTDLVTVGLGGNDFNLFGAGLIRGALPDLGVLPAIGDNLRKGLRDVRRAAPDAKVVLVGYPRLVDYGTSCPGRLPFTPTQISTMYAVQGELNLVMRRAAAAAEVVFVDLLKASRGHGICSRDPWVNGRQSRPGVAAAYHPMPAEMSAAADEIRRVLESTNG